MTKFGTCQDGYPKLIVYEGDTLVALTMHQVDLLNLMENQTRKYRDLSDTIYANSKLKDVKLFKLEVVLELLRREGQIKDELQANCDAAILDINNALEKAEKKAKRRDTWMKIFAAAAVVEAVIISLIN